MVMDKDFEAEMDASTLAEARVISQDAARLARAKVKAQLLADKRRAEAAAMSAVARAGSSVRQKSDGSTTPPVGVGVVGGDVFGSVEVRRK